MTEDEARRLATRFIDTWPTGARAYVWRDLFIDLEPGLAIDAYHRLEVECDRAPTPGQFHAAYRAARAALKAPDEPVAQCELCDGTGWVDCTDDRRHGPGCSDPRTCHCHAVVPCKCSEGAARVHTARNINAHNGPARWRSAPEQLEAF